MQSIWQSDRSIDLTALILDRLHMDWLQFFSSVIGSLAWPAVVAYLLYLLREQLGSLADRLKELTLPGGTKALFHEQLAAGATGALTLAAKNETANVAPSDNKDQAISSNTDIDEDTYITSPRKDILNRFIGVMKHLHSRIDEAPLRLRLEPSDFIFNILYQENGYKDLYDTFITVRQISTSAYNSKEHSIGNEDAKAYRDICAVFLTSFDRAFDAWYEKLS